MSGYVPDKFAPDVDPTPVTRLALDSTFIKPSAAGHRVLDQVVDVVESDLVDRLLYFERAWRCVLYHRHDRGLDRRAPILHAGYFFDDDRYLFRKVEVLPHPVANLLEGVG